MGSQALAAYRQLFRTISRTFSGDPPAIGAARRELQQVFRANRNLSDPAEIEARIAEAQDANEFLRENVIQATKKDCGAYELSPEKARQLREMQEQQAAAGSAPQPGSKQ